MTKTILAKTMLALTTALLLMGATAASAQSFGTAAEAKAMLEKATAALKADEKAALAAFPKTDGGFRDRDLYVFCYNQADGKFTAHPNPALMGTDVRALKAGDDVFGQRIYDAAKEGAIATVNYNFPKPGTTDPVPKESFVTKVGDQGCGVGYYK